MIDDIEGDAGGQESTGDTAPSSEPVSDRAEELTSEIRRSIDTQRERGPDGKFVRTEGKSDSGVAQGARAAKGVSTGGSTPAAGTGPAPTAGTGAAPEHGIKPAPPLGFSVPSKQAWDTLPDAVKADIVKRETDIETGMRRYSGLANFAESAERNGTTLQNAVSDYVAVEDELRKDPVSGVEFLFRKMGKNPLDVLKGWLSRYVPQQGSNGQQQPAAQLDPAAIVAQATQAVRAEFQQRDMNSQMAAYGADIAKFSADPANRFFANVRQDMALLVQAGKASDLRQAYDAACWLHPEIRAILLEEARGGQGGQRTAARAQNAAKAVSGAPSGNSHAGEAPRRKDLSLYEEISANVAAQKGAA
jgi:hypothetical protein